MNRLERNCRRVVGLLPSREKTARGEEILAVLMDLSAGRTRPPLVEVAAIAALSVRLRARERARRLGAGLPVLVAALVMVVAPYSVGYLGRLLSLADVREPAGSVAMALLWLVTTAGWLFGYRRTAVTVWAVAGVAAVASHAAGVVDDGLVGSLPFLLMPLLPVVLASAVVVAAAWRGVPAPQPRWAFVALLLASTATLVGGIVVVPGAPVYLPVAAAAVTFAVVAVFVVLTGRTRWSGLAPGVAVAASTAVGLVPLWLGLVVVTAAAGMLISRPVEVPADHRGGGQPAPSTRVAT